MLLHLHLNVHDVALSYMSCLRFPSGDMFGDHLRSVQRLLQAWGMPESICHAGLLHSIYGTEGFQDFQLSLDRRGDVKNLIGEVWPHDLEQKAGQQPGHAWESTLVTSSPLTPWPGCPQRAEFCAFCNCVMDRATLDATLSAPAGQHSIRARPDAGGAHIPLTDRQLEDLITVHLADWLEQVRSFLLLLPQGEVRGSRWHACHEAVGKQVWALHIALPRGVLVVT